ncbi:MAG: type IV-A pilus assembly ATPase PilB [Candidatus Accumulibacter phosphatis]|uniref:Type II traffic warden ATPase n=1 Tax=Candidatus Accumulibacter cognatus TaxID=2954383 RepID=A0A080M720_9PROT|nr:MULTISPECIES: type IV-A pilus assembly ATPase PilB [Candidatus Accumulibacter]MCC2868768.1 type IV-A pilus assembly ATPase PilB [Candidatus Accumulibacter phosphatis]KFB76771.1 MAG: Type II traffic warden ATPase [Candidatus Accumulibacter cognatus]MBL8400025.1 type IV-A pilus assembly ATPase PilB [Accumulibacter sp.]MBN8518243.1 type IV-A pilus assembly ATPase PilB [Accumulibacter sp.]MBO3709439.1 type IV-A pilus assembly ATPase PilB [Accumulibacter sp.]
MAANPQQSQLNGLARALVQAGRLKEAEAESLLEQAIAKKTSLIEQLVAAKKASFLELARFSSDKFGFPLLDLAAFDDSNIQRNAIDRKLITAHQVVPLHKRGNRLAVAIADPTNLRALDEIRFQTGLTVDPVIVEENKLIPLVAKISESAEEALKGFSNDDLNLEFTDEQSQEKEEVANLEVDDAPVVRFIQKMMLDAINDGASDIHFEPYEKNYRIRFRTDGILREVAAPPLVIKDKIASRIKVISRLNIAEKRVPQDGRMRLVLSKHRSIDFRVSTLPTMYGEKIVLRILDPASATMGIDALGYEPEQKAILLDAIHRPYGMILVTGPTGSGKTVSLYTCLNILNKPGVNISTAEDPAEIPLPGINQVNVDDKAGLSFPVALKAFLRQDPDIIMVGEIRDVETAEIAIKAAQTGHMVLSTLHTNDAPATLTRLMNMGIPTFNLAASILLITAQRLVRRLCTCKKPLDTPIETLLNAGFLESDLDGSWTLYGPGECELCKGSGYKGRVGLYEVMPVTEAIQRIIMANGTELDIAIQARKEGVNDLRRSGLLKVMQGLTSLDEVLGSTNV